MTLARRVRLWGTPRAADANGPQGSATRQGGPGLNTTAVGWATPTARDWEDGASVAGVPENGLLGRQAPNFQNGLPSPTTSTGGAPSSSAAPTSRRRLNPRFVAWLMGFPHTWAEIDRFNSRRTATPKCRKPQKRRGACSSPESESR